MKKAPQLYSLAEIQKHANVQTEIDGQWVPCRPLGLFGVIERVKLAYGVFTGRYDALKWPLGQ